MTRDAWLARLSSTGIGIHTSVPIIGEYATNADCVERALRVDEALGDLGIDREHGDRHWYTTVMGGGLVCGHWARSVEEAVIESAMWRDEPVVRCEADDDQLLREALLSKSGAVALW